MRLPCPMPQLLALQDEATESSAVAQWIQKFKLTGVLPHEFGIFVRSEEQIERAVTAVKGTDLPFRVLDEHVDTLSGHVAVATMHLAKGLEFRAVAVMACDDEVIPLQARIERVGDEADIQEVYETERQLLYVACTRARDFLLVSGIKSASEFLDDLKGG